MCVIALSFTAYRRISTVPVTFDSILSHEMALRTLCLRRVALVCEYEVQVATSSPTDITNALLRGLPAPSLNHIKGDLEFIDLKHGNVLFDVEEPVKHLIFPARDAMISLLSLNEDGELAEVGIIGYEGVAGFNYFLGAVKSSHRALVQVPGKGWRIKAAALERQFDGDSGFRMAMLRYVNFMVLQISQTALCNRLHSVEERLARWLLLSDERVQSDQLPLTHEMLSHMLGTRRSTVTLAAAVFQEAGFIRYQRGRITILNRKKLQEASCPCFHAHQKNLRWLESGK
jgi:CRP-like cAMP-binding protein